MKAKTAEPICNKDCFHCVHPDCVNDQMGYDDYLAIEEMESEFLFPKSKQQRKVAERQRRYAQRHKEKIAAHKRAYYQANKAAMAAHKRAYCAANKGRIAACNRAYYEANKSRLGIQHNIRVFRLARGISQTSLAQMIGVTQSCISAWECGATPAHWDKLLRVLPELHGLCERDVS